MAARYSCRSHAQTSHAHDPEAAGSSSQTVRVDFCRLALIEGTEQRYEQRTETHLRCACKGEGSRRQHEQILRVHQRVGTARPRPPLSRFRSGAMSAAYPLRGTRR